MPSRRAEQMFRRAYDALIGGNKRRTLLLLAVFLVATMAGGLLFAWSGLVPVAASSGHWDITYWFLDFTKRNTVELRAPNEAAPSLGDPALALKAAGHYATGCAPCHGAPGEDAALISKQMTPVPPRLAPRISRWQPAELFWIVKHGIKYTGMPAWPAAERDDEVWAMVSFLLELPTLTPDEYARLAYGAAAVPETMNSVLANCARCHGADGAGRGDLIPRLANQREAYLLASLHAFANGERHSGIMQPVAADLDTDALHAMAEYFAALPPVRAHAASLEDAAALARGAAIAAQGMPERGVPACMDCHGPGALPRNPLYPELAGQPADYLMLQLELFKAGKRGGTPYAHIMRAVTRRMPPAAMRDVARYYASLSDTDDDAQ